MPQAYLKKFINQDKNSVLISAEKCKKIESLPQILWFANSDIFETWPYFKLWILFIQV